jgi:hypothetical protein
MAWEGDAIAGRHGVFLAYTCSVWETMPIGSSGKRARRSVCLPVKVYFRQPIKGRCMRHLYPPFLSLPTASASKWPVWRSAQATGQTTILARMSIPPPTVLMSAVGLPWLKSIMPNSRMSPLLLIPPCLHLAPQVVPFQSLYGSRRRFLHRRVCPQPLSVPKPA